MSNPVTHKVVSGDTLFSLGKKYGLTVTELKSINNLTSDTIKVGQILKLTPFTHTVVSGDTLFSLAKKHNTTVDTLKSLNGLKSDTIKIGQILRLPEIDDCRLLLVNEEDIPFINFDYSIELLNGVVHKGRTDNNGYTQKIIDYLVGLRTITIYQDNSEEHLTCCYARNKTSDSGGEYEFGADNSNIKQKKVKAKTKGRELTKREIALAQVIFGLETNPNNVGIDYSMVRVHHGKAIGLFQQDKRMMTPNGEIYLGLSKKDAQIPDLVLSSEVDTFVHEMVHVWQYQRGYGVKTNGLKILGKGGYDKQDSAYNYVPWLTIKNDFSDFNMEQQGQMIEDYFSFLRTNGFIDINQLLNSNGEIDFIYVQYANGLLKNAQNNVLATVYDADVLRILNKFMSNSNDKTLLPTTTDFPK